MKPVFKLFPWRKLNKNEFYHYNATKHPRGFCILKSVGSSVDRAHAFKITENEQIITETSAIVKIIA